MGYLKQAFAQGWQNAAQGPLRLLLWVSIASMTTYLLRLGGEPTSKLVILKTMGVGFLALTAWTAVGSRARKLDGALLALGLSFGAIGDVLIAGPDGFIKGLGAFLIGHIFYTALFLRYRRPWNTIDLQRKGAIFFLIVVGTILTITLAPHVSPLKMEVNIYTLVLIITAATAFMSHFSILVRVGVVLFLISDGLIAVGRFMAPVDASNLFWQDLPYLIWGSYCLAQLFIYLGARHGIDGGEESAAAQTTTS